MKTSKILPWIIVVAVIIVGWYLLSKGGTAGPSNNVGSNGSSGQNNTAGNPADAVLKVSTDATLGTYLVAENGMTLYTYTKDTDVSNCNDACAINWPPYSPGLPLVAGDGVTNGEMSVIERADGSAQLTYRGAPVYFYVNDKKPGDVTGQNVGGVWFIVKP